jgi:hypothetical protein
MKAPLRGATRHGSGNSGIRKFVFSGPTIYGPGSSADLLAFFALLAILALK